MPLFNYAMKLLYSWYRKNASNACLLDDISRTRLLDFFFFPGTLPRRTFSWYSPQMDILLVHSPGGHFPGTLPRWTISWYTPQGDTFLVHSPGGHFS